MKNIETFEDFLEEIERLLIEKGFEGDEFLIDTYLVPGTSITALWIDHPLGGGNIVFGENDEELVEKLCKIYL